MLGFCPQTVTTRHRYLVETVSNESAPCHHCGSGPHCAKMARRIHGQVLRGGGSAFGGKSFSFNAPPRDRQKLSVGQLRGSKSP